MSQLSTYNDIKESNKQNLGILQDRKTLSPHLSAGDRSYYRSKIFNTQLGINPLIAAASPLLALAVQAAENEATTDSYALYLHFQHEIKAFENNAKTQRYRSETILLARYLLCATIDELILFSPWGKNSYWQENTLLQYFHQESNGDERFFSILDRLYADPHIHIELLELTYICLSSGFLGQFRHEPDGKELLERIATRLFESIRWERGDLKKELNVVPTAAEKPPVARMHLPLWLIVSFTIALLLTIYSSYSYMLGNNAQQVYQQANPILNQMTNGNS